MLNSVVCRYEHFSSEWYSHWVSTLKIFKPGEMEDPRGNRKSWEWCAITQALSERDMLRPGRTGLGFAVGTEPLTSFFASCGVAVTATDRPGDGSYWTETAQHATSLNDLCKTDLVEQGDFERLVTFRPVDMTDLDALPSGTFDFIWSSCALEHLGTLKRGMDFVKNAMRLVKPGGLAVHTTEFNCSSNSRTTSQGDNVLYRRRDLEHLGEDLRVQRCGMEPFDFHPGTHHYDLDYDEAPYFQPGRPHIKLLLDGFVCTSALLIVRKG